MEEHDPRPRPFAPGMRIGLHLTVEGLLTTAPGRTIYLAHNRNPRWYTHICWNCGNKHNPRSAEACAYCQRPLRERRFLLSCRWDPEQVAPFHAFAALRVRHHAVSSPIVLYQYREQLLAFYEMEEEALLVDEPAPLRPRTLLAAAWTLAAGVHHLLELGVELKHLEPEHVLVHRDGARLWDPHVARVHTRPLARGTDAAHTAGRLVGALLRPYAGTDQAEITRFLADAEAGRFEDVVAFQHALRRFARELRIEPAERRAAALSSVGRKRPNNEDAWGWRRIGDVDVYAVADGMGGYAAGDVASRAAIDASLAAVEATLPRAERVREAQEEVVRDAIERANRAVRAAADGRPCGTTLVLMVLRPDGSGVVGHVGDSRAYRWRAGALEPLTEDHSMVAAMVASGKLDREAARVHPRSNVLLRYLGSDEEADPDVMTIAFSPGDRVLLCTDGVWGEIPESQLAERIDPAADPRRALRVLISAANDAGGKDNATGLLIRV